MTTLSQLVEIGHLQFTAIQFRGRFYSPSLIRSYRWTIEEIKKITGETESTAIDLIKSGSLHS